PRRASGSDRIAVKNPNQMATHSIGQHHLPNTATRHVDPPKGRTEDVREGVIDVEQLEGSDNRTVQLNEVILDGSLDQGVLQRRSCPTGHRPVFSARNAPSSIPKVEKNPPHFGGESASSCSAVVCGLVGTALSATPCVQNTGADGRRQLRELRSLTWAESAGTDVELGPVNLAATSRRGRARFDVDLQPVAPSAGWEVEYSGEIFGCAFRCGFARRGPGSA
ncbi:MAG: hypothetical protein ACRDQZ_15510, partial [Mycobacteriales bacterium]